MSTRVLVPDLLPNTQYAIQLRAVGPNAASEWSRRLIFTTISDSVLPATPTNTTWVVSGDSFHGEWDAVTQNVNGDAILITRYEVELVGNSITQIISVPPNSTGTKNVFDLNFATNNTYFNGPAATVTFRVRAVDNHELKSAFTAPTLSATNAAPTTPTGLTATELYDAISLTWNANTDVDLKGYRLQVSTTGSGGTYSTIYEGTNNSFVHNTTAFATDHYYKVAAIDKFGTLSSYTAAVGPKRPKTTFAIDTTPPAAPATVTVSSGFNTTTQQSYIDVSWAAVADSDLAEYVVRYATSTGTGDWNYITVPDTTTSARISVNPGTAYYVGVAAKDISTNISAFTNASTYPITSTADTSAPSQPSAPTVAANTLQIQVVHDGLKQGGGSMESDVAYYEVYASTTTGFTTYNSTTMLGTIQAGPAIIGTFDIPANAGSGSNQTWYVKVRAVDRAGNVSAASNQNSGNVNLIASANIADLAVTNAKINDLAANKITAGTGLINDLTIKSTLTLGDSTTNGVIRSNDYVTSGGKKGVYIDSDEIIIREGTISAAAMEFFSNNIWNTAYADFELASSYYTSKFSGSNATFTIDSTDKKFGNQSLRIVGTSTFNFMNLFTGTVPPADWTAIPGKSYTLSFYGMVKTGGTATPVIPLMTYATSVSTVVGSTGLAVSTLPADSVWRRYSFTFYAPQGITGPASLSFFTNLASTYYIDAIQIEENTDQLLANGTFNTALTPWVASSGTTVARQSTQSYNGGFAMSMTATSTASQIAVSTNTPATDGVPVIPGVFYQASAWIRASTTTRACNLTLQWYTAAGAFISQDIGPNVTDSNSTWKDISSNSIAAPSTAAFLRIAVTFASTVALEVHYVDEVRVWNNTPSIYRPPGATRIDGTQIKTGGLQSFNTLTLGGIALPYWAITMEGSALFSNMLIRGNTVVGANAAEGNRSYIKSYNWDGTIDSTTGVITNNGSTGWVITSDGTAIFKKVAVGTFPGSALEEGTVGAEALIAETALLSDVTVDGSIHTTGVMGEDIGISSDGFFALGPWTIPLTTYSVTAGVATLNTTAAHGFTTGNKLMVSNVATGIDGIYTINSTPTTTSLTFLTAAADVGSTSVPGGTASSMSVSPSATRTALISFPTDGTKPNIFSGAVVSDTLTVESAATFSGAGNVVSPDAVVTLGSTIVGSKTAPALAATYPQTNLSSISGNVEGFTRGHNTNWFVAWNNANTFFVSEFDDVSGTFIQNNVLVAREDHALLDISFSYQIQGITYSSTNSKYYVLVTSRGGQFSLRGRREDIYTYDTSWVLQDIYTIYFDADDDAGWFGSTIGWDYVADKPLHCYHNGTSVIVTPINLTSGMPVSNAATVTLASVGAQARWPGFIMRNNDTDGVATDRYFFKDHYYGTSEFTQNWTPFNTSGTMQSAERWPSAYSIYTAGGFYDSTEDRIYSIINNSQVIQYQSEDSYWSDTLSNKNRYFTYTWYDPDPAGAGTGTHQSNPSPVSLLSMPKRATVRVTISKIPKATGTDTPTQALVYIAQATSTPSLAPGSVSTAWHLRETISHPNTSVVVDPVNSPAGAQPPDTATNEFATLGATPGILQTQDNGTYIKGDGSAKFGSTLLVGASTVNVGGAWTSYTPALTNWGLGNGTVVGKYMQIGKTIKFMISVTLGSTSTTSGNLILSLPVAANTNRAVNHPVGIVSLQDTSVPALRHGFFRLNNANIANVVLETAAAVNGTSPWTWASTDKIMVEGQYEAA